MGPLNAVIRTRDVSFDDVFYDPAQLDLGHILREDVSHLIEILDPFPITIQHSSNHADDPTDP
jgi:hypothetical protein